MVLFDCSRTDEVDRYLDAVHGRNRDQIEIDPTVAATIHDLIAMTPKTAPPGARERVWRQLMQTEPRPTVARDRQTTRQQIRAEPYRRPRLQLARASRHVRPGMELAVMTVVFLGLLGVMALGTGRRPAWRVTMPETGSLPATPATGATSLPPVEAWQFRASASIFSSAVAAGPLVYVTSADGQLHAVEATTGQERWHTAIGRVGLSARARIPAVANGTVYICGTDGQLWSLNAMTGKELGRVHLHGSVCLSSPTVTDGIVLIASIGSTNGYLDAFNATTGQFLWFTQGLTGEVAGWSAANGAVYVADDNTIDALDLTTGHPLWHFQTGIMLGRPIATGNTVYVGGGTSTVIALDAATGRDRWRASIFGAQIGWPGALSNGLLYITATNLPAAVASPRPLLIALDAATGSERWRFTGTELSPVPPAPPLVHDGLIYAGLGRDLTAIDATTGHERWRVFLGAGTLSTPTVTADAIYVGSVDDHLYALRAP